MRTKLVGWEDLGGDDVCEIWVWSWRGVLCVFVFWKGVGVGGVLGCACRKEGVSHLSAKRRSLTVADLHCCSAAATLVHSVHGCCHVGFPNRLQPPSLISERDLYRAGCTRVTKEGLQSLAESNSLCLTEMACSYSSCPAVEGKSVIGSHVNMISSTNVQRVLELK